MPVYEFNCSACGITFEEYFRMSSDYREGEVKCTQCGSTGYVKKNFSPMTTARWTLSANKKNKLKDLGYKMSKGDVPGLKKIDAPKPVKNN